MSASQRVAAWRERSAQFLATRSRRERLLLAAAAAALGAALLLRLGLAPAWQALQSAPQEQARLAAQWAHMQHLQAQSAALRQQPRRTYSEAALRASLTPLGEAAQLRLGPQGAELELRQASPEALADWLVRARTDTGAVVREAHLERAQVQERAVWNGRLRLDLAP